MTEIKPAKILDVKGFLCPIPVVKAKKAIRDVSVGEVLVVLSTDPASKADIPAWTNRDGQELVKTVEDPVGPLFTFWVRRKT